MIPRLSLSLRKTLQLLKNTRQDRFFLFLSFLLIGLFLIWVKTQKNKEVDFVFISKGQIELGSHQEISHDLSQIGLVNGRKYPVEIVSAETTCLPSGRLLAMPDVFCLEQRDFDYWSQKPGGLLARYLRAFRERGFRRGAYYIKGGSNWESERQELARLMSDLRDRKFFWSSIPKKEYSLESKGILGMRRLLAGILSIGFLAWIAVKLIDSRVSGFLMWMLTALAGSGAWIVLQSDAFISQTQSLGVVRAAFVVPWLAVLWVRRKNWGWPEFLSGALILFFIVRLDRMLPVSEFEHQVRDWVEVNIGLRPRFKELLGWTLFLLTRREDDVEPKWRILGLLGPISIMNSFLHAHTPWSLVVSRSLLSFVMAWCVARFVIWVTAIGQEKMRRFQPAVNIK